MSLYPNFHILRATTEITRPNNTTPYSAYDVISDSASAPTILSFTNMTRVGGGSGYIVRASLLTNQSTNTASYRLNLFRASLSNINDNSPFTLLYANRDNFIGRIDFDVLSTDGTGSDSAYSAVLPTYGFIPFDFSDNNINLYGILSTKVAFTPAANQKFFIELLCEVG